MRLYPASFRSRFGADLVRFYRADRSRPEHRGLVGGARFWARTVTDLLRVSWSEHRSERASLVFASRGGRTLKGIAVDFRQAWSGLRRAPGFTVLAVATFGVGVGAATTMFSVVHGVLLTPLPLPEADRLVQVEERELDNPDTRWTAWGNYADLRASGVFEELSAWSFNVVTWTGGEEARQLVAREVTASFFPVVGVAPVLGRVFGESEQAEGEHRVVVLSHWIWRSAFDGEQRVLGSTLTLEGEPYTVIGVMPPDFDFPFEAEAWVPLRPVTNPACVRRCHRFRMTGRLLPGTTLELTQAAATRVAERLEREHPVANAGNYFIVSPQLDEYVAEARPALLLLTGAVGVLLLIACVNMTGLILARSLRRAAEVRVRSALGATGLRLAGLLVAEAVLLGVEGALAGSGLALLGVRGALALASDTIPRAANVGVDVPVLVFAAVLSFAAALLVSLLPAIRFAREANARIASGTRLSAGRSASRIRRALVVSQLALALMLTTGTVLLTRSFLRMAAVDTGIEPDDVVTVGIRLPDARYPSQQAAARYFTELLPQLEAIPAVERAGATLMPPIAETGWRNTLTIRSRPVPESERPSIRYDLIAPGYFEAIGARVIEGRDFAMRDLMGPASVAIVNRAAADRYWPETEVLGQEILGGDTFERPWLRVVGVVEDVRQSLFEPVQPEVYVPIQHDRVLGLTLVIRARPGTAPTVVREIREVIATHDRDVPITATGMLRDRIDMAIARPRFNARLISIFAGLAVLLACVGTYGVLAFGVSLRRREIGIRTAIGAGRTGVIGLVLREATLIAGFGITLGVLGSLTVSSLMSGMLFEIEPTDPVTLVLAVLAIAAVAFTAALRPAWVAASIDPVEALRPD
jgi:predicted permease